MNEISLLTEGDVNDAPLREKWNQHLDPATRDLLRRDSEVFMHQALSTPCLEVITAAEGIYLTGASGKKYMDFHGNSVHQLGHKNPYVLEKVKQQMETLVFCPRRYTHPMAIEFSEKLVSLMPEGLTRVLYAPGGTSVVGIALKLARIVTGKHKVVSLKDSFHGASLDAIAVGGEAQFRKYMEPLYPETIHIAAPNSYRSPYPDGQDIHDAEALERVILEDGQIGAFIAETIRNTDVQIPSREYWQKIREICSRHQVLLILDEIPIAFGRTGSMFAFEHYAITPDILCLGKGLGAGVIPFAAMVTREEYNVAGEVSLGHYTHEKNPLGCAAAMAMLEYIGQEHLLEKVADHEKYLKAQFQKMSEDFSLIGDVRGIGLLWGIELVKDRQSREKAIRESEWILYDCLQNGLSFKVSQGNVLQLCPSLIITEAQLDQALEILRSALSRVPAFD